MKAQSVASLFSTLFIVLFQLNCAPLTPEVQGRQVLEEAAETMGGLLALEAIETITRKGIRTRNSLGQGPVTTDRLLMGSPVPFTQMINFDGPREVNLTGPREAIQLADWNKGGYRDVFGSALRPLEATQLKGYRTEWDRDIAKFLVHALGIKSSIKGISEAALDGKPHHIVSLQFIDAVYYDVYLDDTTHLITKLQFTEDRNPYGDLAKERTFSDYRDVENVKLPFSEITKEMNEVTEIKDWAELTINGGLPEDRFVIPEGLQERAQSLAHSDRLPVLPTELAQGVYFGEGVGMNNMWVEFEDFILVAEGPNNEVQSLEVIRQIRETVGDKPIRYLVTSHHHADHTGGIRTYAAEGTTIITHVNNEEVIREILTLPHILKPDRLFESQIEPQIETVTDRKTITDGTRTVELIHVPNPHANGFLAIYLPKERLIFESDLFQIQSDTFQILPEQSGPARVPPEGIDFYNAVTKARLRVNQIVPGHGRVLEWKELVDAVNATR
jgi:glyoxylase-like metal-dependent hydrolase (beta-lactamase superfamily II)